MTTCMHVHTLLCIYIHVRYLECVLCNRAIAAYFIYLLFELKYKGASNV